MLNSFLCWMLKTNCQLSVKITVTRLTIVIIVTCHRVITHGAEELCVCCHHCAVIMTTWHWSASDQLVPDIGEHCTVLSTAAAQLRKQTPRAAPPGLCYPPPPRTTPYWSVLPLHYIHFSQSWHVRYNVLPCVRYKSIRLWISHSA